MSVITTYPRRPEARPALLAHEHSQRISALEQRVNLLRSQAPAFAAGPNALSPAFQGGADPGGTLESAGPLNAALSACQPGQAITLPWGQYRLDFPVVLPPGVGLMGIPGTASISPGAGTILVPSAQFSAGIWPVAAAVLVTDQVTGHYAAVSQEQHLQNLLITGSSLPGSSNVTGVALYSGPSAQITRVSLRDLLISGMTGWGFSDAGPQAEVHVRAFNVNIRGCGTNHANNAGGFNVHSSDSEYLFCGSYSNYGDAWNILDSWDSAFGQCHGEHSASGYGFHYKATYNNSQPDAGGISFDCCTVDAGAQHGWFLESTGTALPPVTITGGFVRRPGSSGTYAGVCAGGYFGPLSLANMQVYPGQPDGGGGNFPAYALQLAGNGPRTNVTVSGGTWAGTSAFLSCDGSQGLLTVSGDTTFGSGTGSAATLYTPGVTLQAALSAVLVPVDRVLATAPAGAVAASHDRIEVTGTFSPGSGTVYYRLVFLTAGVPVSFISTWVTGGQAKSGGSHAWCHIVSVATGLVTATSADHTDAAATWGATETAQPIAMTSPYLPPVSGAYWLGTMIAATTMPTLGSVANPSVQNLGAVPPIMSGPGATGQTTPPPVGAAAGPTVGFAADDYYAWAT